MVKVKNYIINSEVLMELFLRKFKDNDFVRIRNKLVESYVRYPKNNNWLIDRWNFCRYVSQNFNDTFKIWPETLGIWVDNIDSIIAIVNSEGENSGEVFFNLFSNEIPRQYYLDFVTYAESKLRINNNNYKEVSIRINQNDEIFRKILIKREYKLLDWKEALSSLNISKEFNIALDPKYRIIDGKTIKIKEKSIAHSKAFGYTDNKQLCELNSPIAFEKMKSAPDYNPILDLAIIDESDEILSFVTFWYDSVNKIGILEPVGTIPEYRKIGFAKLLIFEGCNRLLDLGCSKIYVGSDQEFYKKIGFKIEYYKDIYFRKWK